MVRPYAKRRRHRGRVGPRQAARALQQREGDQRQRGADGHDHQRRHDQLGHRLARQLDLVHFDTAVNMGPGRAVRFLQKAAGCGVDGDFGSQTEKAVQACRPGDLIASYCATREAYYRELVRRNASLGVFLKGWLNRLNALRSDILNGRNDTETLHALDLAVSQLDLLVSDLQNAVMKTRMQPIGRLFQKYPRIARDLARNLGKDVELVLAGEETEIDKTMIEDLSDPIIHLIRNAVDHGVEETQERLANGKPEKSIVRLEARQEGDHIVILVADDGRGMNAEKLRAKAVDKGLITDEEANTMDERQSYNLVFLPGFSMASQISDVSGRGVGMDVVRTNIQKLNGSIDIRSSLGKGTTFIISLPLTLAILPVLLVRLGDQPFAVPLSMVREILPIEPSEVQEVGGRATMVVRGEVLPIMPLSTLLGWDQVQTPEYGVLMQSAEQSFILAIDSFAGREDAVIKSLDDFRPKGVAGVTTLSNGQIVLILDMKELLGALGDTRGISRRRRSTGVTAIMSRWK